MVRYSNNESGLYARYMGPLEQQVAPYLKPRAVTLGMSSYAYSGFDWNRFAVNDLSKST